MSSGHHIRSGGEDKQGESALQSAAYERKAMLLPLDAVLRYMRQRNDDFTITEARFLGMIPLLSGSPLD